MKNPLNVHEKPLHQALDALEAAKGLIESAIITLAFHENVADGPYLTPEESKKAHDEAGPNYSNPEVRGTCPILPPETDHFASFDNMVSPDRDLPFVLTIAERCHEANRAYCRSIGDNSQVHWLEAPQWQKDSAVAGVKAFFANPLTTPEQSHAAWVARKRSEGWIYAPTKNIGRMEHPCLCDYDKLTEAQKVKDSIFLSTCSRSTRDLQRRAAKGLASHMPASRAEAEIANAAEGEAVPVTKEELAALNREADAT